jgi:carboxyl-terminal processing protease
MLFSGLSCQLASRAWESLPIHESTPTWTATSTPTTTPVLPTSTQTSLPSPTKTPLPSTPTLTQTSTPAPTLPFLGDTPTPLPLQLQLEVFEQLWQVVDEEYLYPDYNGLDWDAIHTQYRKRIVEGLSNEDFYQAMKEMINRLGDDHSSFLSPDEVKEEEAAFAGKLNYVGIGILAKPVPERKRAVILVVFPGSPAQEAGIQSHDSILSVDGVSILDDQGYMRNIIRGPVGSVIQVQIQSPGQQPRTLSLTRQRVSGPYPVPFTVLKTETGKRIGYILLVTFADETVVDQVKQALQMMSFNQRLDGLIIDNRMNEGGLNTVLNGVLAFFTQGKVGSFVNRKEEQTLRIQNQDMLGSQKIPLVVLVGKDTVSFGEIFAGILKDIHRAHLIGETTEGNVEILWGYNFKDDSRAWIAHETFRPLNHPDQNWEKTGIIPDDTVPANWDEVTLENDPAVKASLEYLDP